MFALSIGTLDFQDFIAASLRFYKGLVCFRLAYNLNVAERSEDFLVSCFL